jgi:hypothetical protein
MEIEYHNELHTVHEVKIAVCYLLEKIMSRITEKQLYEIIFDIEFINYFLYAPAIEELIVNDSIARVNYDGTDYIELREKGKKAAEELKKTVHYHYRKKLLEIAFRYNSEKSVDDTVKVSYKKETSGYKVEAVYGDKNLELMQLSLYAPDEEQAEFLKFQIRENPLEFYKTVINSLLFSKRPITEIKEDLV